MHRLTFLFFIFSFILFGKELSIKDNPYKYSGYYRDIESDMDYLMARYYSPELMRFTTRDSYDKNQFIDALKKIKSRKSKCIKEELILRSMILENIDQNKIEKKIKKLLKSIYCDQYQQERFKNFSKWMELNKEVKSS